MERLGFQLGNLLQAACFFLLHLTVLIVNLRFWPAVLATLVGGWLFGWLRHRSGSILPGWLGHTLLNTTSDLFAMLG
jgi:membrane protease YdiL (CAAX protease family)